MGALPLLVVLLALNLAWGQESRLSINISTDNNFTVAINGQEWFRSGPIEVRNKGKWLSSVDGSLILDGTYGSSGVDVLGTYSYMYFEYHDKPERFQSTFRFTTYVKVYDKIDAIVFGQKFVSGAEKAATDSADGVISSFPSIFVEDSPVERGYVTFEGNSKLVMQCP